MFAGLWESPTRRKARERRERNQRMAAGVAAVVSVAAAGAATAAAVGEGTPRTTRLSDADGRLYDSFWHGFTDTAGAQALQDYESQVSRTRPGTARAETARASYRSAALLYVGIALAAGTAAAILAPAVAAAFAAGVPLAIAAWLFRKAGPEIEVEAPSLPSPPVVLPSTTRSSPARPLLSVVATRRVQIERVEQRIGRADPLAAQLLRDARNHGEAWVADCASRHELHRYFEHRDKTPRRGCPECDTMLADLTRAVDEYQGLAGDASQLGIDGSLSVEAVARRAGIQALGSLQG